MFGHSAFCEAPICAEPPYFVPAVPSLVIPPQVPAQMAGMVPMQLRPVPRVDLRDWRDDERQIFRRPAFMRADAVKVAPGLGAITFRGGLSVFAKSHGLTPAKQLGSVLLFAGWRAAIQCGGISLKSRLSLISLKACRRAAIKVNSLTPSKIGRISLKARVDIKGFGSFAMAMFKRVKQFEGLLLLQMELNAPSRELQVDCDVGMVEAMASKNFADAGQREFYRACYATAFARTRDKIIAAAVADEAIASKFLGSDSVSGGIEVEPVVADLGVVVPPVLTEPVPALTGQVLDVPNSRQIFDFDCGAAATMSVCGFYGVGPKTEQEFIEALGSTEDEGTPPQSIVNYLRGLGLSVVARQDLTIQALAACVSAGLAVICCIQDYESEKRYIDEEDSGHWVVVIGAWRADTGWAGADWAITLQDPSAGRVQLSGTDFLSRWEDRDSDENEYIHFGIIVGPVGGVVPALPSLAVVKSFKELDEQAICQDMLSNIDVGLVIEVA